MLGWITTDNISEVIKLGVDEIVIGSSTFENDEIEKSIRLFNQMLSIK